MADDAALAEQAAAKAEAAKVVLRHCAVDVFTFVAADKVDVVTDVGADHVGLVADSNAIDVVIDPPNAIDVVTVAPDASIKDLSSVKLTTRKPGVGDNVESRQTVEDLVSNIALSSGIESLRLRLSSRSCEHALDSRESGVSSRVATSLSN